LRLLRLPAQVQLGLRDKKIDMGHARAILSLSDPQLQLKLYAAVLREGLSVRKVEELARKMAEQAADGENAADSQDAADRQRRFSSADFDILSKHLALRFATNVKVNCDKSGKGRISFPFTSEEELERLIAIFDTARTHD
ncbi:MAG: chromosome partitioning protein ParB, partial [Duncaniella sp.]|nr:chromosome partitioning protein ParB [Duncaniella sp.]